MKTLNRRHVLRGAMASLALPFLHSALPKRAWATPPPPAPRRLVWWFMPNGMLMEGFTPTTEGTGFALPPSLALLSDVQSRMTVISGMSNPAAMASQGDQHGAGTSSALTDVPISVYGAGGLYAGTSVDQVAAKSIGVDTPFPSLQLGTGEPALSCGADDCVYRSHVSWAAPTTPLTPLSSPLVLFERMFGSDADLTAEQAATRLLLRTSVLDAVDVRASGLQSRLGSADAAKLDEYLTGVRELESRLQQLASIQCAQPAQPMPNPGFGATVDLMIALIAKAFECDLTRVVTFMLGDSTSVSDYAFLGVSGSHHTTSHHLNDPPMMADLSTINAWGLDRMADIARSLSAISEGEGDALASTMIMLTTDLADPNTHVWDTMPMMVLGGEAHGFTHGRHLKVPTQPHSNLWLTALDFVGMGGTPFGHYASTPLSLT